MYRIGVDLGGTNIAIGIVDEEFNIVLKDKVPTLAGRPSDEIIKDMKEKQQLTTMRILIVVFIAISVVLAIVQYRSSVTFIAQLMGISQSYISRLEKRIMLRLRKELLRQTNCV